MDTGIAEAAVVAAAVELFKTDLGIIIMMASSSVDVISPGSAVILSALSRSPPSSCLRQSRDLARVISLCSHTYTRIHFTIYGMPIAHARARASEHSTYSSAQLHSKFL